MSDSVPALAVCGPLSVKPEMGLFLAGKVFLDSWKCIVL